MPTASIHVGDVGTVFADTIRDEDGAIINLSTASSKTVKFGRADGTVSAVLTADFDTDGTDGVLKYETIAGTLGSTNADAGQWTYQFFVTINGKPFHGDVQQFYLKPNIE